MHVISVPDPRVLHVRSILTWLVVAAAVIGLTLLTTTGSADATMVPHLNSGDVAPPSEIYTNNEAAPGGWNVPCTMVAADPSMSVAPHNNFPPVKLCVWCVPAQYAPGVICFSYLSFWGCGPVLG